MQFATDLSETENHKPYVIIDEYDHYANDLIAMGTRLSNEQCKSAIWVNVVVCDFYEALKDATQKR